MRRILILLFFPISFIGSLPLLFVGWIVGNFNRAYGRRIASLFTRFLSIVLMKLAGAEFIVTGLENNDPAQNYLYVSNHRGLLDTPTLAIYANRPLSFISKIEMAKVPILHQWMILLKCLFIDRSDNRAAIKTIFEGIENLKMGDNLVIYPQGTRSRGEDFLPFKQGSFKLAIKSGIPVLPVSIRGTDDLLENNTFNVKPSKVYVHFGKPIDLSTFDDIALKHCATIIADGIKEKYDSFISDERHL
jgi:1-acyl-sn-glycerol-3-phosphate acyltransferase